MLTTYQKIIAVHYAAKSGSNANEYLIYSIILNLSNIILANKPMSFNANTIPTVRLKTNKLCN